MTDAACQVDCSKLQVGECAVTVPRAMVVMSTRAGNFKCIRDFLTFYYNFVVLPRLLNVPTRDACLLPVVEYARSLLLM